MRQPWENAKSCCIYQRKCVPLCAKKLMYNLLMIRCKMLNKWYSACSDD